MQHKNEIESKINQLCEHHGFPSFTEHPPTYRELTYLRPGSNDNLAEKLQNVLHGHSYHLLNPMIPFEHSVLRMNPGPLSKSKSNCENVCQKDMGGGGSSCPYPFHILTGKVLEFDTPFNLFPEPPAHGVANEANIIYVTLKWHPDEIKQKLCPLTYLQPCLKRVPRSKVPINTLARATDDNDDDVMMKRKRAEY
jgi:hypothetical protein